MSSDGKPLSGFRKIFFLIGVFYWVCAIWTLVDFVRGADYLKRENQPDAMAYQFSITMIIVEFLLGLPYFWFWLELRKQRFTRRNWITGLVLLIPNILCFPLGIFPIISWCSASCRNLFNQHVKPPPLQ